MQILLQRTWGEIAELISHSESALLVLQIINQVSRRNWCFQTTFDAHNLNNLYISSDTELKLEDFESIANGVVVELFNCNSISFTSRMGQTIEADVTHCRSNPPPNNILVLVNTISRQQPGIMLSGYCGAVLPQELSNMTKVEETFRRFTWFGTKQYTRYRHKLLWKCLTQQREFCAEDWEAQTKRLHPTSLKFTAQKSISFAPHNSGTINLLTFSGLHEDKLFHGKFGEVDPTQVDANFWQELFSKTKSKWYIEFDEQVLRARYHQELTPYALVTAALAMVKEVVASESATEIFKDFRASVQQTAKTKSAKDLKDRQLAANHRAKVVWQGKELMCEPEGETEVVYLLAKLEALDQALPVSHFALREYTPSAGIDALADYQISEVSKSEVLSPIEIEHKFENFLKHGHPLEQVSMIVCWKMITPRSNDLKMIKPGLYQYHSDANHIWVIVIRDILGIEVHKQ